MAPKKSAKAKKKANVKDLPAPPSVKGGFNPQPDPPRLQSPYVHPGLIRAFDPQPDPPRPNPL